MLINLQCYSTMYLKSKLYFCFIFLSIMSRFFGWVNYYIRCFDIYITYSNFSTAVEVLENLAYLANASNLVLYLSKFMHFSPSSSAIIVTNFMGTAFLLAILGGFLADAFFTTYSIYLISAAIEFMVSSYPN